MKIQKSNYLLLLSILLISLSCGDKKGLHSKTQKEETHRIGFYNVENLFDLVDDPNTADEEFTPTGKKKWNLERYQAKLDGLAKVIQEMKYPQLLGLCEVENMQVLKDLAQTKALAAKDYQAVHFESPDFRGIDVALLYQKSSFKVLHSNNIPIHFPKEIVEDYTTRDILQVSGILFGLDTIEIFVNHWPSRRGGLKESEPKRLFVAQQLSKAIKNIKTNHPTRTIVLMGDFNDESNNNSVLSLVDQKDFALHNCSAALDKIGKGTYNYRGSWNMLDQIIVSKNTQLSNAKISIGEMNILRRDWLMYNDPKNGPKPNKTYGGPNYYGGYSDHLPVYVELKLKQ